MALHEQNEVFIFSLCTVVTPAHMGHFSHYMYSTVYAPQPPPTARADDGVPGAADDAKPILDL
ncbi:Hypothetical predicted protein [Xyrichtys novacula]|uniref:Uncharacterized protein n=1 Tax=Xyrichtys novacula TaxID=13765 RepID=A0AAV1GHH5_XYRNO|nr:Hypothetical predicted protein [Xyrichtys novacula]